MPVTASTWPLLLKHILTSKAPIVFWNMVHGRTLHMLLDPRYRQGGSKSSSVETADLLCGPCPSDASPGVPHSSSLIISLWQLLGKAAAFLCFCLHMATGV